MNVNVISQALINMGYRKAKNNVFLKPIGFALLLVEFRPNENCLVMTNAFNNAKNEYMIWSHKDILCDIENECTGEELYNEYCNSIALAESEIGLENSMAYKSFTGMKTFAFKTDDNVYQIFN